MHLKKGSKINRQGTKITKKHEGIQGNKSDEAIAPGYLPSFSLVRLCALRVLVVSLS
jgi:hypothetical protein